MNKKINWAFFGSSEFSVEVLENLKKRGLIPNLVVTIEDKPRGRKLILTPEEVKVWAEKEKVPYLQLKSLKPQESYDLITKHFENGADVFVVTHYGKMIPDSILDFPKHKTLNIHPSLLPKLRGPSPIKSAILTEEETGVTIIRLDSEMDHGPILSQEKVSTLEWPPYESELEPKLAKLGSEMLLSVLPKWVNGEVKELPQNHEKATFCSKIEKKDAELNLNDPADINLKKIRAYCIWPGAYYFDDVGGIKKRIVVKKAKIENNTLILESVVPEGKKEMPYADYLRGKRS